MGEIQYLESKLVKSYCYLFKDPIEVTSSPKNENNRAHRFEPRDHFHFLRQQCWQSAGYNSNPFIDLDLNFERCHQGVSFLICIFLNKRF